MEPIVYKSGAFPANAATDGYIAYKVGWNDGIRKFNLFEQRKFGWQCHNTTSGAYDTFAEAYAAAEKAAAGLTNASCLVALLDREDNARHLLNSWGLSPVQKEELLSEEPLARLKTPAELNAEEKGTRTNPHKKQAPGLFPGLTVEKDSAAGAIGTVGDLRRALERIPDSALLNIGTDDLGFEVSAAEYDGISVSLVSKELEEDMAFRSRNVQAPDELVARLAHYAGELVAVGQIKAPDWDDLCNAIQTAINSYYDYTGDDPPSSIEQVADEVFRDLFPTEQGKASRSHLSFRLPDGTVITAQHMEGDVAAHDKDQRTWQAIDIARYTPDGVMLDALCCVDYEDTLGLRSLVYANNDLEEPIYAHKHEISPVPAIPLDTIIKGAQERRDAAQHENTNAKEPEIEH